MKTADLAGKSLADVLQALERGRIGHRAAMDYLHIDSYRELTEIMHANGCLLPGHQPRRVSPETRAVLRRAIGKDDPDETDKR